MTYCNFGAINKAKNHYFENASGISQAIIFFLSAADTSFLKKAQKNSVKTNILRNFEFFHGSIFSSLRH